MKLLEHIRKKYKGSQVAFAKAQNVKPQQVTKWINMNCIVVGGLLYSPRRSLTDNLVEDSIVECPE